MKDYKDIYGCNVHPNLKLSIYMDELTKHKKMDIIKFNVYRNQRKQRGFDDSELQFLNCVIAKFIIIRLKEFISYSEKYNNYDFI